MSHKKLLLILATMTMIIVFACKKEDNETLLPVKHTVFAGMDVSRMVFMATCLIITPTMTTIVL